MPLVSLVGVVWIVRAIYGIGYTIGFSKAILGMHDLNKGQVMQTPSIPSEPVWIFIIPVLVAGYLRFLRVLPSILDLPETKDARG